MKTTSVRTRTSMNSVLSLAAVALLVTGAVLYAGPLDPPAGPITSTGKTLTEVEPRIAINATNTPGDADSLFKITQPGSYYLTGNITGVVGKHGIAITASGVTLDLNGFELVGVPAMGSYDGVRTSVNNLTTIAVVNGSVRNWGDEGVDLMNPTFVASNCRIEGVLASGNGGSGISAGIGNSVTNCSAYGNTFDGIFAEIGSTVTNCSAHNNARSGINTSVGCMVTNCAAKLNTNHGISAGSGSTVTNCSVYQNASGISTGNGCTVTHCSVSYNTASGIGPSDGGTVTHCSVFDNGGYGIIASGGATVAECTVSLNTLDGILCFSGCLIRGNTCSFNGSGGDGAGIHGTNSDNRIEGNTCISADRGIDVDVAGNIIIKNTCSGNTTNWDVVAGNTILVVQGTSAGAVLGNTGGLAPGSTDPNANFTY